ncbi:MAG: hypothetical protein ABIL68_13775 [bacterium]
MSWQNLFSKLAEHRREKEYKEKKREKEMLAEAQRINETFAPSIHKVCIRFAKTINWEYQKYKSGYGFPFSITLYSPKKTHDFSINIDLIPLSCTLSIEICYADTKRRECHISLDEYTEEILAKALYDYYNDMDKIVKEAWDEFKKSVAELSKEFRKDG